jgi:hypothetical protein
MSGSDSPPADLQHSADELLRANLKPIMHGYAMLAAVGHPVETLIAILIEDAGSMVTTLEDARERAQGLIPAGGEMLKTVIDNACDKEVAAPWLRVVIVTSEGTLGAEIDTSMHLSAGSEGSS